MSGGWVAVADSLCVLNHMPLSSCAGTTGKPKGVRYTHRSNFLHALIVSQPVGVGVWRERYCAFGPQPQPNMNLA